jgi:4-hydroxy-tetrahydrodipicolinate synthase
MFKGVYTALVTPFHEDGSLDEAALRKLVDLQIAGGVAGLLPMGTTGESPTVDHREHTEVIRIVIEQARGRVPVIAGTGSNSTQEAVDLTIRAKKLGAAATLQVSPYYNKPTQEGLYRHFTRVADEGGLPVIVYNIPGRTGVTVENETMLRLSAHKNIAGVKEATGNMPLVLDLMRRKPADFDVLSGDDNITFPLICLGGVGVISVVSNLTPAPLVEMVAAALAGDVANARRLHNRLYPLFKGLFIETNPIPVKAAMAMKGLIKATYRLPLCPLSAQHEAELQGILKEQGLL